MSPASQADSLLYSLSHQGSPRILERVAYPFSRGSFWPRNWTGVSCIADGSLTSWTTREGQNKKKKCKIISKTEAIKKGKEGCCIMTRINIEDITLVNIYTPNKKSTYIYKWRRKWQPTPVFSPGKSYGQRYLVGYSPWTCKIVAPNLETKQ